MEQTFRFEQNVLPEWVDYNGHMNDAEYARAFSCAGEAFMDFIGLGESGRAEHAYTIFTLETHICYLPEVVAEKIDEIFQHDQKKEQPKQAGRQIGIKRKK